MSPLSNIESRFLSQNIDVINKLSGLIHFNRTELEALALIYIKSTEGGARLHMPRKIFRMILTDILLITDEFLVDQSILILGGNSTQYITLEQWFRAMSLLLRGNFDEKIAHCFKVYDQKGKGQINRDSLVSLMSRYFETLPDAGAGFAARDLVDFILRKLDADGDGILSCSDYQLSVKTDPDMLQCFGQCLPDRDTLYAVLTTFSDMRDNKY